MRKLITILCLLIMPTLAACGQAGREASADIPEYEVVLCFREVSGDNPTVRVYTVNLLPESVAEALKEEWEGDGHNDVLISAAHYSNVTDGGEVLFSSDEFAEFELYCQQTYNIDLLIGHRRQTGVPVYDPSEYVAEPE